MVGGGFLGLLFAREAGHDVRTGPVLDRAAHGLGYQEDPVLGELLGDPPRGLRGQPKVLGSLLRARATLLVGQDRAVEEHPQVVACDAGFPAQHHHDAIEGELAEAAAEVVRATEGVFLLVQLVYFSGLRVDQLPSGGRAHVPRELPTPDPYVIRTFEYYHWRHDAGGNRATLAVLSITADDMTRSAMYRHPRVPI